MESRTIGPDRFSYSKNPDHCPVCSHGIEPTILVDNVITRPEREGNVLQIIYRCPRHECQEAFIASYRQGRDRRTLRPDGPFILRRLEPIIPSEPEVADEIKEVSPNYFEILSQAKAAEGYRLTQISGVGYRKALEFLIKDYCIAAQPDREEEIKKVFLGNCIINYVTDENVKQCARRATWLGNDETHYVRKWEDKDIEDLKILIRLTEAWVVNSLLTSKYLKDME